MSWSRQASPMDAFMADNEEWKARAKASQIWVSTLGVDDSVLRAAVMSVRATNCDELKAEIATGTLLRQRGMGPARMARARKIAGCEFPAPVAHMRDAVIKMLSATADTTGSEVLRHDLVTMIRCLKEYGNVTDCKLYDTYANNHFAPAAKAILGG